MSNYKGIPGPWECRDDYFTVVSSEGQLVADVGSKPTANLIAAAPELLEALQCLKRELVLSDVDLAYIESHFRPHIDRAHAAIAKALGQ